MGMEKVDLSLIEAVILVGMRTDDGDMETIASQSPSGTPPNTSLMHLYMSKTPRLIKCRMPTLQRLIPHGIWTLSKTREHNSDGSAP